ncbi:hypothetical protein L7F22_026665 [Adiantum nelumboides]|nr:hypothetical protein [Adiantum nelumboides]
MKPFFQVSSSTHHPPTLLQLSHPFTTHKNLPYSFPSLPSLRKIAGKDHTSLLWVRVHRRCSKPLCITVFLLNKDGSDTKNHEDEWFDPHVKLLLWGVLQRWGPPAAVGAMVGSIVARNTLVFVLSFSFVLLMAVHKAMAQGVHLKILSRKPLVNFLASTRLIFSTVILHLSGAFIACCNKSSKFFHQLSVLISALLANTLLTWNRRQGGEVANCVNSADTIISDITACMQNVEGMVKTDKDMPSDTRWTELKDNLSSLRTKVALLSKDNLYIQPPTEVPLGPAVKSDRILETSTPTKSKGSDSRQSEVVKLHAIGEDKIKTDMSKQEAIHEMPGELDVLNGVDVLLRGRDLSTKLESGAASEVSLDLTSGLLLKNINDLAVSDAQTLDVTSVKVGKSTSSSPRTTKYIDYWTEQHPIRPVSSEDMEVQKSNASRENLNYQKEDWVLRGGQDLEIPSKTLSSDVGSQSFHTDKRTRVSNEAGFKNAESRSGLSVKVNDGDGSTGHVTSMNDHSRAAGWIDVNNKAILNGMRSPSVGANVKQNTLAEQGAASIGSTKELAFVREDADLHVLTGFSRSFNDGEFQKLMTGGETALRHGKAGLFGKIEVGEAEAMLYKAADQFASAAALDLSSVEAVGFWGNTLLVHGELKLMLSRELRHLISTPDVISPYWIRQTKGMEAHEKSNRAVLQRTFQTVCEECEELLVQAGRKYRRVLSISNSEVRALYNWGLALCFRAQLIAEEGGQVFLSMNFGVTLNCGLNPM